MPEQMLTRREAADLIGCSYDTIRRREGEVYPNAGLVDGTMLIPLGDLVAAGHYTPAPDEPPTQTINRVRDDREAQRLREELAVTRAHLASLEQQLIDARDERTFLRSLLQKRGA